MCLAVSQPRHELLSPSQQHKVSGTTTACCAVRSHGGQQEEADANERVLTVQFTWNGQQKDVSSMFIGTSPEFEMALYTLCFLAGQEENVMQLGDYEVKIKVYRIKSKYGDKVGSAFPEVSCTSFVSPSWHLLSSMQDATEAMLHHEHQDVCPSLLMRQQHPSWLVGCSGK